jgi:hypothetical protein
VKDAKDVKDANAVKHLSWDELAAGLADIQNSPRDEGALQLIVRRPALEQREILMEGQLERAAGLVGDSWSRRASSRTPDGSPHPDMQLNIINARVIALLAQRKDRWPLAGDQLYIDLDLSGDNLPAGTRLALGSAVIEVTSQPHTGCSKFAEHFGPEATRFVNSTDGKALRLRGVNAKVVQPGTIRVGDLARKL